MLGAFKVAFGFLPQPSSQKLAPSMLGFHQERGSFSHTVLVAGYDTLAVATYQWECMHIHPTLRIYSKYSTAVRCRVTYYIPSSSGLQPSSLVLWHQAIWHLLPCCIYNICPYYISYLYVKQRVLSAIIIPSLWRDMGHNPSLLL